MILKHLDLWDVNLRPVSQFFSLPPTQAGAKSLVMSMWSVPDKETRELMIQSYRNTLSGKMNRCQGLRQAALKQM